MENLQGRKTKDQLHGRSREEAERYGKPCIGAFYAAPDNVKAYRRKEGALCVVCGAPATDTHHWPPLGASYGGKWTLETAKGWLVLKPSLFAVCRRCHDLFHAHRLTANWVWDSGYGERAYWDGVLLRDLRYMPHSLHFYELGHWEFEDGSGKLLFSYREVVQEDGTWKALRGEAGAEPAEPAGADIPY